MKPIKKLTSYFCMLIFCLNCAYCFITIVNAEQLSNKRFSKESIVPAADIDLGDYKSEMSVGTTQLLNVTVLPTNADEQQVTYYSSQPSTARINMLGRITALQKGSSEISVVAGTIKRTFTLKVVAEYNENESMKSYQAVESIEVSDFKNIIKINEAVDLTVRVSPQNATYSNVTYSSSHPNIATINSSGQIKGISAGKTKIVMKADKIIKSMILTVKVATKSIELNRTSLVLSETETFQLLAHVIPKNAEHNVTFKSTSPNIVSVTKSGFVKALKVGTGSIIVSTWDASQVVNIIVNNPGNVKTIHKVNDKLNSNARRTRKIGLVQQIAKLRSNGQLTVQGAECKTVTSAILKELYGTQKALRIEYPDYVLIIKGIDIRNIEKELNTVVELSDVSQGLEFIINQGSKLMGKVHIQILNQKKYSHLYLYNNAIEAFEEINTLGSDNKFIVDSHGKYILTQKSISNDSVRWVVIVIIGVISIVMLCAYVAVKKTHWFW